MAAMGARAKDAAAQAVPIGKRAGTTVVQGAAGARDWAAPRVQGAVRGAREWTAPRLEDAAEAVTTTVAPKVSSTLRSTASYVRPPTPPAKTGVRRLPDRRWLLGLGALLAAAGTTAAVAMRRRYARATADAKDATEPDATEQAGADDPAAEASSVNGRVTTPGN
jgi:hypothetical protein